MITPRRAIAYGLTFAFLLFLAMDLLESIITNETQLAGTRIWHFARGFIATSSAMLFVWLTMHRKEKELIALRDQSQQELQESKGEVLSLSAQREVESKAKIALQSRLDSERGDFLAVINHRLRTPILASLRISVLLQQGAFGALNEEQSKIVRHLVDNESEVSRLLDNLVDVYSYKNGVKTLETKSTDMDALIEGVLEESRARLDGKSVSFELNLHLPSAVCDQEEISKLVRHLLDNAGRHARSRVTVDSGTDSAGHVFIAIEDDGLGIPAEDVDTLFDRFYLLSAAGKYAAATGVGLCLCNEIAKAHGGVMSCESIVGKGTRFSLRFPVSHESLSASTVHR